jgi:hypothetical protein
MGGGGSLFGMVTMNEAATSGHCEMIVQD